MRKRTFAVYIIQAPSPNGATYIGKDSNFPARMNDHRRIAFKPGHKEFNSPVHRAIRKYGWDRMRVEALDRGAKSLKELARRERLWVWLYKTVRPYGYNLTKGGEGTIGYRHTDTAKEKLSKARRGTKASAETKRRISEAGRGRTHSEETKSRIRAKHLGKVLAPSTRALISKARRGTPLSADHRQAIAKGLEYLRDVPRSDEIRAKIKASHLRARGNVATFEGPNGESITTSDIRGFAAKYDLQTQHLYHVLNRTRPSHKGWRAMWIKRAGDPRKAMAGSAPKRIFLPRDEAMRRTRCIHVYELTDPHGQVLPPTNNLTAACKEYGLDQRKMTSVVSAKKGRKSHRGWTGRILDESEAREAGFVRLSSGAFIRESGIP